MLTRRSMLRASGLGALGLAGLGGALHGSTAYAGQKTATIPDRAIGTQLFTCTASGAVAMPQTLDMLAQIGYQIVEHAGYGSTRDAKTFKAALDNSGLRCTSGHTDIPHPYDDKKWKQTVEDALLVGQRYIVCASKPFKALKEWRAYAETLNKAGAVAQQMGLVSIGHHNHTGEWKKLPGSSLRAIDVVLQHTDPDVFHWEMDIGWAYAGLGSIEKVQAELRRYPKRFRQFHVKDIVNGQPVLPGYGEIGKAGFAKVFGTAKETGQRITDYLIEDDTAVLTCADAELTGYQLLHGMTYTYKPR